MRAVFSLITLLVALLVLTPFASASTFESWIEGLYDAESHDVLHAVKSPEGAIECAPLVATHVLVVVSLAAIGDGSAAPTALLPARPCRAPPALFALGSN